MATTTFKKFESILIEEGASCALLEQVEAHAGLEHLARRIRAELGMAGTPRRPRIDPRRAAQVVAAAEAADRAAMAASLNQLVTHFG